jgi:hypothetical protein
MPGHYKLATALASNTKLTPARLQRIVEQFRRWPAYRVAAAAGGVNRQTLLAWRRRGELDREFLEDGLLEQVLELRFPQDGPVAQRLAWDEVERRLGVDLSPFFQLAVELERAQLDFVNERFARITEAAAGRRKLALDAKGSGPSGVKWESRPVWQAAAWQLERLFPEFRRPRSDATGEGAG